MFRWDSILSVDLYWDASNLVASCYMSQIQDGEAILLVYDIFTWLFAKQNDDIYRRKLFTIVKFINKYFHMLNVEW